MLAVVVFHADLYRNGERVLPGGFLGVDIFFVISGFLITGLILKGLAEKNFSLLEFYARRVRRIFPALALTLAATWAIGWFVLLPEEYRALGKHIAASMAFVVNFVFWGEAGYFDVEAQSKPLLHLWSLAIEEQFYIVWPLVLALSWRHMSRWLGLILAAIVIGSFAYGMIVAARDPSNGFYLPFARFWELGVGGLLAYGFAQAPWRLQTIWLNLCALAGLVLIVCSLTLFDSSRAFPGWWALMPAAGTCLLIAAQGAWLNTHILGHPIATSIGLIS